MGRRHVHEWDHECSTGLWACVHCDAVGVPPDGARVLVPVSAGRRCRVCATLQAMAVKEADPALSSGAGRATENISLGRGIGDDNHSTAAD